MTRAILAAALLATGCSASTGPGRAHPDACSWEHDGLQLCAELPCSELDAGAGEPVDECPPDPLVTCETGGPAVHVYAVRGSHGAGVVDHYTAAERCGARE